MLRCCSRLSIRGPACIQSAAGFDPKVATFASASVALLHRTLKETGVRTGFESRLVTILVRALAKKVPLLVSASCNSRAKERPPFPHALHGSPCSTWGKEALLCIFQSGQGKWLWLCVMIHTIRCRFSQTKHLPLYFLMCPAIHPRVCTGKQTP